MCDDDDEWSDDDDEPDYLRMIRQGGYIADWAKPVPLKHALQQQEVDKLDPDLIFSGSNNITEIQPMSCDLESMFAGFSNKNRFRERTVSADWSRDKVDWVENLLYKKRQGYKVKF